MDHLGIVGAGGVGTAIAFAALNRGVARRLSLYDVDAARAKAEVLDLRHGLQFVRSTVIEGGDDIVVCQGADVVVVTAGAKQRPGETRPELATRNADLLRSLLPSLVESAPGAVILLVTNPVDVLTQLAIEITGRDNGTILGSGTLLDSSRLRHLLAVRYQVAERHIHAHVVGEHGDSETVLWSSATIGGAPLSEVPTIDGTLLDDESRIRILTDVRNAAYEIIAGKGATTWAIAMAAAQILDALDHAAQRAVLPVTAPIGPEWPMEGTCISLPRMVDADGAGPILPLATTDEEMEAIRTSAQAVQDNLERVR